MAKQENGYIRDVTTPKTHSTMIITIIKEKDD